MRLFGGHRSYNRSLFLLSSFVVGYIIIPSILHILPKTEKDKRPCNECIQRERRKTMRETCKELRKGSARKMRNSKGRVARSLNKLDPYGIILHPDYKLLFCKTAKAGSSSWMYNFEQLYNITILPDDTSLHLATNDYEAYYLKNVKKIPNKSNYIKWIQKKKDGYLQFILVRHPFERILSAYRDKLEDRLFKKDGMYFFNKYGGRIVRWFRTDRSNRAAEPTFREFVHYLISTPIHLYNYHWKPSCLFCYPCLIKYDVVVKMETFNEDSQYIIQTKGIANKIDVPWRNRKEKEMEVNKKYYNMLTTTEVQKLYNKYWCDFNMFGYSVQMYLQFSNKNLADINIKTPPHPIGL